MLELPLPSVTILPLTPEPVGTPPALGAVPAWKVMVLPLTIRTSPSDGAELAAMVVALGAPSRVRPAASLVAVPAPSTPAVPTRDPAMPPSVIADVTGEAPPAVPVGTALLITAAVLKGVVPPRSLGVEPAVVGEEFDLVA